MNKTGYFTHPACRRHDMGRGHPECPARLDAIDDRLLLTGVLDALDRQEAPPADDADLLRAHTPAHLAHLRELDARLAADQAAGGPALAAIDPDTSLCAHSLEAAWRAAGAAVAATDAVVTGALANAFCATRPPGHHAEHGRAMGFCLLNNVAVGVRRALEVHGLQRVAVVDFDVHHGNGTEDILHGDERVLMVGLFQHPFYPFTGEPPAADNMHNVPVPAYTRGPAVREIVSRQWLPLLEAFRPEMIFISAGFDAHREDELGQLGLVEADYTWITEQLQAVALRHAGGRIVSCLEGGYALDALACSVEAHVRVLAGV
ncbi:histone deacetylase family protein [Xylophilus rhododendri]|uniref:Histone deacetylase family protein n=1 Tax=Xylophilus rhododendri TaxID=2697032 RepID=A0A857JET6_9BURK|nr:histone deacetylase family protein [Xylophilus rhododendri]QHJ01196.1 histone deacetylase family protein [Xylophilus rhododendri]